MKVFSSLFLLCVIVSASRPVYGFGTPPVDTRKEFLRAAAATVADSLLIPMSPAQAADPLKDKLVNIPDDQLRDIIRRDVVESQFLVNGKLTRSVYAEG